MENTLARSLFLCILNQSLAVLSRERRFTTDEWGPQHWRHMTLLTTPLTWGRLTVTEVTRISVQRFIYKSHSYGTVQPKIQRIRNYEKCRNQYKITNTSKKTEKRTNGVWLKFTLTVSWLNVKRNELFLTDKNCKKHWPTRLSLYQKTWQIT